MNRIKMGYFPTDLEHIRLIKQAVNFPKTQVNILDPCCGEGLALKAFAENENADTYGIELDESRGHTAQKNLDRVGLGSFFRLVCSARQISRAAFKSPIPFLPRNRRQKNGTRVSCRHSAAFNERRTAYIHNTLPQSQRIGMPYTFVLLKKSFGIQIP